MPTTEKPVKQPAIGVNLLASVHLAGVRTAVEAQSVGERLQGN